MCTAEIEQSIVVCDVAIGHVRHEVAQRLPSGVISTGVERQGTHILPHLPMPEL